MRAALLVAAVAGCGPALEPLVAQHHLREAVCAAHDGSPADAALVRHALVVDADARLHVALVPAAALARLAPSVAAGRRVRFARVRLQTNLLPLDALTARVAVTRPDGQPAGALADWEVLATATGEHLPAAVTEETYATPGNALRTAGAIATLGFSLLFTHFTPGQVEVQAPRAEYERLAPEALALHDALVDRAGCAPAAAPGGASVGARCDWFVVLDAADPAPIVLTVTLTARADRLSRDPSAAPCTLEATARLGLGRVADLDATTEAAFGGELRRVPFAQ